MASDADAHAVDASTADGEPSQPMPCLPLPRDWVLIHSLLRSSCPAEVARAKAAMLRAALQNNRPGWMTPEQMAVRAGVVHAAMQYIADAERIAAIESVHITLSNCDF